ncbi:head-tail adaptor [Palleronia marisminoris]|uniref:Phage head-tail joining protein n=1 Tax=Palleronia marisminoris TaxID=315423 RepID=A0A1Y5RII0_9RHOB|nr:head-tail adaptor protein [Palleronia marisminoris]SFG18737.1 head-tail adaptor [Palleronia marisminoris]SLN16993.1 Phage head-tail joining protein [Palleronia marisminoris]
MDFRPTRALVLETRTKVSDGAGGTIEEWAPLGTLWADMRPRTGGLSDGQEVSLSRTLWRIVTRGAPAGAPSRPVAGQRFREDERIFGILTVTEGDPQAKWLVVQAEEEVVR